MKCHVDYDRSEVKDFTNDADKGHQYLRLTLVPNGLDILSQAMLGANGSSMVLLFYPQRLSDGTIDQQFEDALIDAFDKKKLNDVYADKIEVEIPPTLMTYSSNTRNHNAGDWVMDGDKPRITTSIRIASLTKIVKGEEIPIIGMNELKSRAIAIRDYRIQQGEWFELSAYEENILDNAEQDDDPADIDDADIIDETPTPAPSATPRPATNRQVRR